MTRADLQSALATANVAAFLRVTREGETVQDDIAYQMMYGGGLFQAPPWEHPREAVTIRGITSTAAGAYQILAKTWDGLVKQYGFEDFSPGNQDLGAVALIAGRRALQFVIGGHLDEAIRLCAEEWASLPGSPYGQPTQTLERARAVYAQFGGQLAEAQTKAPVVPEVAPIPAQVQPVEAKSMGVLLTLLPTLVQMIPQLGQLFGSGSEVSNRNLAAAKVVADTVVQATQSTNVQDAIEKMTTDSTALQSAKDAVSELLPQLMDVGGGVESARKFAAEHENGRYGRILEVVTYCAMFFLLLANCMSAAAAYLLQDASILADVKQADIGAALIAFGYFLGSSISSKRKDEIKGAQ